MLPDWLTQPRLPFAAVPAARRVRLFDTEYAALDLGAAGRLYVTRHGWPVLESLLPESWYVGRYFARHGKRMTLATGCVYYVRGRGGRRPPELLVKFSRVGQDVPVWIAPDLSLHVSEHDLVNARFVGPFEEFGLCEEMRRGTFGPPQIHLRVKRPLAIYTPPNVFQPWQMGRSDARFAHSLLLQHDDPSRGGAEVPLDIHRDYILLYGWVAGDHAQSFYESGALSEEQFAGLVPHAMRTLAAKGFRMLDMKPAHLILRRRRRDRSFLRRDGRLAYVVVDYELVVRTPAYELARRARPPGTA